MKTVKEVSRLTGLSVRALHHYDAIGLLRPSRTTPAGYRLYDDAALERLQMILLFRELEFPLEQIRQILDATGFDRRLALMQQLELLEMKRERLTALIDLTRGLQSIGGNTMDFSAFDRSRLDEYAARAREAWGDTPAYSEYEQKRAGMNEAQAAGVDAAFMAQFAALGRLKSLPPEAESVQRQVDSLRRYISANYYTCTLDVFESLGGLYASGAFTESIDSAGGEGTADFASKAIAAYCRMANE